ncbi:TIR domain-containing protein [Microbacterium aurantiacum]|uniref:TIR domain-containing protein n=1 Tax=Microbacterium aurantiacum TaxID=162393 RepID=UPI003D7324CF
MRGQRPAAVLATLCDARIVQDSRSRSTDFFVSYNYRDLAWAEWIAWQLEAEGFSTTLQAWDFLPGSNFVLEMDRAVRSAQQTLVVLSPNYLESSFTPSEWATAFARDPTGTERRLIPVRVAEFGDAGLLNNIVYVDLVGAEATAARTRLLDGVRRERRKPTQPPSLPQTTGSGSPARETRAIQAAVGPISRTGVPQVAWRRDLPGGRRVSPLTIEIELVPTATRVPAETHLPRLAADLENSCKQHQWFSPRVSTSTTVDTKFVRIQTDSRWQDSDTGVLLTRYGQRGGWLLPGATSMSELRQTLFLERTAQLLRLLFSIAGMPYDEYAVSLAAGSFHEKRLPAEFVVDAAMINDYAFDIAAEILACLEERPSSFWTSAI